MVILGGGVLLMSEVLLWPLAASLLHWRLEDWALEVVYCDPERSRAFLRILSTEGRGVCLWWAVSKP